MSVYPAVRSRYRYRAEVPEKAKARASQVRWRGRKRDALDVLEKLAFEYIKQRLPVGETLPTVEAARLIQFAYRLARYGSATDPEGDHWQVRSRWELI